MGKKERWVSQMAPSSQVRQTDLRERSYNEIPVVGKKESEFISELPCIRHHSSSTETSNGR